MYSPTNPAARHIPGYSGLPICGTAGGRTSVVQIPTCLLCRARMTPSGMGPEDVFNAAHPIGRVFMGSGFGFPGFPHVPGLWRRFRGG